MVDKRDWLGECNDQHIPLEDFQRTFCERCLQVECTRSQHGKSRFDARVADWESRLFIEVPRMDPSDPRYGEVNAKRFVSLDTTAVPEVRSWVDPRELKEPPPPPEEQTYKLSETTLARAQAIVDIDERGTVEAPVHTVPDLPASPEPPARPVPQAALMNTPHQSKQMVGKPGVSVAAPAADAWELKKATTDGLQVVPRGAKIRLGGSGV